MKASLSTRGQLVVPKTVRERHGWTEGTELEVVDLGASVLLRRPSPFAPTDLVAGFGMLQSGCGPVTVEQMDEAVARMLRNQEREP